MTRVALVVHIGYPVPAALQSALRELARTTLLVEPRSLPERALTGCVWWYGTDPGRVPCAVWLNSIEEATAPAARQATVLLARSRLVEDPRLVVLRGRAAAEGARFVSPFTRARLRRARQVGGPGVLDTHGQRWTWDGTELDDDLRPTAAALAGAARAHDLDTALGLARWGAPLVTDAETARALGAEPGRDVALADVEDSTAQAARLADDRRCASRLGWAGYRLAEDRWSVRGVLDRFGVVEPDPAQRLDRALEELGTPPDAMVRARSARATDGLAPGRLVGEARS